MRTEIKAMLLYLSFLEEVVLILHCTIRLAFLGFGSRFFFFTGKAFPVLFYYLYRILHLTLPVVTTRPGLSSVISTHANDIDVYYARSLLHLTEIQIVYYFVIYLNSKILGDKALIS